MSDLAAIVAQHKANGAEWSSCVGCDQDWPCDTAQVLALLRETREAAQAFLDAAALESMTKAPGYIAAKRHLRAVLNAEAPAVLCICGRSVLPENWANHLLRQDGRHAAAALSELPA